MGKAPTKWMTGAGQIASRTRDSIAVLAVAIGELAAIPGKADHFYRQLADDNTRAVALVSIMRTRMGNTMADTRSKNRALTQLYFVRALSMLALVLEGSLGLGSEHGESAGSPRQNANCALPPALNELMIGCSQEGAINYLSQKCGYRLEHECHGSAQTKPSDDYDDAYVLRLESCSDSTRSSHGICLYFRDGHLAHKCVVADENVDPHEVFRREIKSGVQHPLNRRGLMDRIQWGRPSEPGIEVLAADTFERVVQPPAAFLSSEPQERPKVRCGIAVNGLPEFATQQGYNLLVVYQNMGPTDLSEEMLLGYPANPGIMVTAKYADHEQSIGYPGNFGIYGAKAYRWRDGAEVKDVRRAAFRLRPGEATYMWFQVPNVESCRALQAKTYWLRGATEKGDRLIVRDWDADSPEITTARRPVRTCSGITE